MRNVIAALVSQQPQNKLKMTDMAWLAVGLHSGEAIFDSKPIRNSYGDLRPTGMFRAIINLPKGSIAKLIGRELTWRDEPVKIE